jgi:hypothetical protein
MKNYPKVILIYSTYYVSLSLQKEFDGTIHVIYKLLNIVFAKLNLHKIEQRDYELRAQLESRVNKRHNTDKKRL